MLYMYVYTGWWLYSAITPEGADTENSSAAACVEREMRVHCEEREVCDVIGRNSYLTAESRVIRPRVILAGGFKIRVSRVYSK